MAYFIKEHSNGFDRLAPSDILITDRKVFFTSDVNNHTADELIEALMALDSESDEEITLYINSPGGEVSSGLAVYDFISIMRSPVRTVVIGTAASMGAILFLAGKEREVMEHSLIMLHDPSYGAGDIGGKKPHEIQKQVDKLMETREELASIIASVTGQPKSKIYEICKEDAYFNARESMEFGLATKMITREASNNGK